MLKVIIFLSLYGAKSNKVCYVNDSAILIESNLLPYEKYGRFITYIDLVNDLVNDFDGKNIDSYPLRFEDSWEAYPPLTIQHQKEKTEFTQSPKGVDLYELTDYFDGGQMIDKYLLLKTSVLSEKQIKALYLNYSYDGHVYLIIEHVKYKRGVVFEEINVEIFNELNDQDFITLENIKEVFK